ncbi:SCAN domain-containing protein 3-like [Centruroides vittatus]
MPQKKKCRQYSVEYVKFGFISSPQNSQLPMCLLCNQVFSNEAMKPSRMIEHLKRKHPDKQDKDIEYFENLKTMITKRNKITDVFKTATTNINKGLEVSYKISRIIAQNAKPHNIGEKLLLPVIKEVLTMTSADPANILSMIPLSNDTISRRISEMANDVENQLTADLQTREFTIQLDESSVRDSDAILMAYVRYIKDSKIIEEMLFCRHLVTDTKGTSIYECFKTYFDEKQIPLKNILACATDGAPSMVGRHRGFLTMLKEENPNIFTIHCIIHRQHLVAKSIGGRLHETMNLVKSIINKIKAHPLNDRLFRQLCHENDEEYERLLLHTEVRWLSKGSCLRRMFNLFDTVISYLESTNYNFPMEISVLKSDIAYLADIYAKINELLLKLQGNNVTIIKVKSLIIGFINKLSLYKNNMGRKDFSLFPCLSNIIVQDENIAVYYKHLESLIVDMKLRFKDVENIHIPDWVINPFSADPTNAPSHIQEILIDLQANVEAKHSFEHSTLEEFWIKISSTNTFQRLWIEIRLLIMAFPTSYLVEKGFSAVSQMLTKQRNRLNICQQGDLRLYLSKLEPNIIKLCQDHQPQGSH